MFVVFLHRAHGFWIKLLVSEDQGCSQCYMSTNHWDLVEDSRRCKDSGRYSLDIVGKEASRGALRNALYSDSSGKRVYLVGLRWVFDKPRGKNGRVNKRMRNNSATLSANSAHCSPCRPQCQASPWSQQSRSQTWS